jgi:hypothetical protein
VCLEGAVWVGGGVCVCGGGGQARSGTWNALRDGAGHP